MLYVIVGRSASGKDTIYKNVLEELDIQPVVPYTTRTMREGEVDGETYIFVSNEKMNNLIRLGDVLEYRVYTTDKGCWYYATPLIGDEEAICIGTLQMVKDIKQKVSDVRVIYIEVEEYDLLRRAINREKSQKNPNYVELCRRFMADAQDYEDLKLVDYTVRNDNLEEAILRVIEIIRECD